MSDPREYDFTKRMQKQWERIQELGLDNREDKEDEHN